MKGITWIVFLSTISLSLSQTANSVCTKSETGCDPPPPSNIRFTATPSGTIYYVSPGPVSLECETSPDVKLVLWMRNNSDGESIILNSTEFRDLTPFSFPFPIPSNPKVAKLEDSPREDKFPYTYECIAFGKCCDEIRSPPVTVSPRPRFSVDDIRSQQLPYHGIGPIEITCLGSGDNFTSVHWTATDENGKNITLNTTRLELDDGGVWQAKLKYKPVNKTVTYIYHCVAENKCCGTKTSSLRVPYAVPTTCPIIFNTKPVTMKVVQSKRSATFSWAHDPDPEDVGFTLRVTDNPEKRLNISAREYVLHGLEPNRKYHYSYQVIFTIPGKECKSFAAGKSFITLPDVPSGPRNFTVIARNNTLNVSWVRPKYEYGQRIHYIIFWRINGSNEEYKQKNVTFSPFVIKNLSYSESYWIKLSAVSKVGIGNSTIPLVVKTHEQLTRSTTKFYERTKEEGLNNGAIAGGVTAALLVLIIFVIILFLIRKRSQKRKREKSIKEFQSFHRIDNPVDILNAERLAHHRESEALPEKTDLSEEISYIVLLEDWEIAPDKLKILDKKLGGGQFGVVRQGLLTSGKGDPEVVAVKTLKDRANESDLEDLMAELKILKDVNKVPHPNVMKLIGGCSIEGKLHVIMEFCPGGNLRSLLIKSRVYPSEDSSSNYINLASTLNHRQLLKIAADISSGMEHLSTHKFIHRDLAARNILIGEDNMAKVSDFGLARDVGGAEEYIRNTQNLLPVKWMALESLLHGRFTTASDVWSYGVVLHEITTLGEEPYKEISPYDIVKHVGSGCRMPQSPQCADEVYEIMKNCWKVEPTDRPTFKEIKESLQSMLLDAEKSYINITHIVDEGPVIEKTKEPNASKKDGATRYTTAF